MNNCDEANEEAEYSWLGVHSWRVGGTRLAGS